MTSCITSIINKYKKLDADILRKALIDFANMLEYENDGRFGKVSLEKKSTFGNIGCKYCGETIRGHIAKTCPNCGNNIL